MSRYYSRRELYALGETLGSSSTQRKLGGGYLCGGGGGGIGGGYGYSAGGAGGLGGGGAGNGYGGGTNTGGGGGGAGGSGVVILSVPTANYSGTTTGSPTITTSGSNTIIKWTSGSGTYTA